MNQISFNRKLFLRTIIIFLVLTTIWTILLVATDGFWNNDDGFIPITGFLLLFSASIYVGQKLSKPILFIWISLISIAVFVIGTFVLGVLIGLTTDSVIIYSIINSIFVSIVMVLCIDRIVRIEFKIFTMILVFLLLLVAYFITVKFSEKIYLNCHIHPKLTMFNFFQFALTVPLALGMNLKNKLP